MKTELNRKSPAHLPARDIFNAPVIVFLTVCTKGGKPILADNETHVLLLEAWRAAGAWLVGRYVIMPDHLHLFCAPIEHNSLPITNWITFWKSYATRRWLNPEDLPIWQRHFWDTQLRRSESYDQKWNYVVENPVRAELVAKPEDWPYQGELNVLRWL
jgi:putative transposase